MATKKKSKKKTSKTPARQRKSANAPTITSAALKAGMKFGYRLIKTVSGDSVTYVNTNGCKPSNKPATEHTVTRAAFMALVTG